MLRKTQESKNTVWLFKIHSYDIHNYTLLNTLTLTPNKDTCFQFAGRKTKA